jgi:hypothetical protein
MKVKPRYPDIVLPPPSIVFCSHSLLVHPVSRSHSQGDEFDLMNYRDIITIQLLRISEDPAPTSLECFKISCYEIDPPRSSKVQTEMIEKVSLEKEKRMENEETEERFYLGCYVGKIIQSREN